MAETEKKRPAPETALLQKPEVDTDPILPEPQAPPPPPRPV